MNSSNEDFPLQYASSSCQVNSCIGIIGGTGLCNLNGLQVVEEVAIQTPYGNPSEHVQVGLFAGQRVAFIPRHGHRHSIPPHRVPYKANLYALRAAGAHHIVATCVTGSLREGVKPGMFVVPDQFINFTWGRDDSYDADGTFIHLPMDKPYCATLSRCAVMALESVGAEYVSRGTIVVIQGPRFSTIAESKMFAMLGGDIVNMTQYPECYFARDLGLCYCVIASVTDYDVGVPSDISFGKSTDSIVAIFKRNVVTTHEVLAKIVQSRDTLECVCAQTEVRTYYEQAP